MSHFIAALDFEALVGIIVSVPVIAWVTYDEVKLHFGRK